MGMFDFFQMYGNHEQRKVARFEDEEKWMTIDTCAVSDCGDFEYETGIQSPLYNGGKWVIVEYKTREEAEAGHERWVETMKNPPAVLFDTQQSDIARIAKIFAPEGEDRLIFERAKE